MYWCHSRTLCIIRDLPRTRLLAVLVAVTITFWTVMTCPSKGLSERSNTGVLKGQVGLTMSNRRVIIPAQATVYVLLTAAMKRNEWGWGTFSHVNDDGTAGGRYRNILSNLLDKNRDLKRLFKEVQHNPDPEIASRIATYYLQSEDEALAQISSWLAEHQNRSWQMRTIVPDAEGFWSAEGLQPGEYEVVVRGKFPGFDAEWEASVDVSPGQTISLPLTRPRFVRHK